jgi:hypothetical protein
MCRQMLIDLDNVDATLRLFDADIVLEEIRPKPIPPRHAAYKGEVARICFGCLRDAKTALTSEFLAKHVMAERKMNWDDKRLARTVLKRVSACLRHFRNKGLLVSNENAQGRLEWTINQTYDLSRAQLVLEGAEFTAIAP